MSRIFARVILAFNHRRHSRRRLRQIKHQPASWGNHSFIVTRTGP